MNKLSIKSFEDPKYNFEHSIQYISKEKEHREKIYKKFEKEGIKLPDYDKFKRKRNLNKVKLKNYELKQFFIKKLVTVL